MKRIRKCLWLVLVALAFGLVGAGCEPEAVDDDYATSEETALNVAAPGLLGNDTDVDGDSLAAALVTGASNGRLTLNADG